MLVVVLAILGACQASKESNSAQDDPLASLYSPDYKPFYHGVASGDPLDDRVIIWTRVTPETTDAPVEVKWAIAENDQFEPVIKSGTVKTGAERDFTVKVDVDGLTPGRQYYYVFHALGATSPVGRTKTLPRESVDSLKFAVVSCSNWQHGYFNAYDRIAEKELDAVLHLGDYIYEYGIGNARNVDRRHLPEHEIITLSDYRMRYAQYHLDPALRNMRMRHPLITIWDDHEVANNSYTEGAQNHQEDEGDYEERKRAARQAYYEWIPIRENEKHYRSFSFGPLADVIMLDERLEGKTEPAKGVTDPRYADEDREMLGREQLGWFEQELRGSSAKWKVIGNQVVFSDLDRTAVVPKNPRNMDSWDGYPAEKSRVARVIRDHEVRNVIFLTGDTHASWAFEVVADPLSVPVPPNYKPIAVEFGTPSVSSTNANESAPDDTVMVREQRYMETNPHLKYVNQRDHGYVILTLFDDHARADWHYVSTVLQPDAQETMSKTFVVPLDSPTLR